MIQIVADLVGGGSWSTLALQLIEFIVEFIDEELMTYVLSWLGNLQYNKWTMLPVVVLRTCQGTMEKLTKMN